MLRSIVVLLLLPPFVGALLLVVHLWHVRRRARLVAPEERADRVALRPLRERSRLFGFGFEEDDEVLGRSEPQEVALYLYFPTRDAAERAAARAPTLSVESPVLAVAVEPAARGATWLCLVTVRAEPSEALIRRASAQLAVLARECGGEFDGWEVALPW